MSNNITVNTGLNVPVSTDEVGGVHYQRMKISDGTPASTDYVKGDSTYGLDVDVTRIPNLTLASQAWPFTSDARITMDGEVVAVSQSGSWSFSVSGTSTITGNVNIVSMPNITGVVNVISMPSVNIGTIPMVGVSGGQITINDGGNPISIDDNAGSLTVDNNGTFAVQASQTGTWTVDLASLNGAATESTLNTLKNTTSTISGHLDGIEGLLTTIDSDTSSMTTNLGTLAGAVSGTEFQVDVLSMPGITGTVSISGTPVVTGDVNIVSLPTVSINDGGNIITVDGTVTANLSATDNQVLDNIDADLTTIIGHVDGIEGSVDGIETLLGTIDADTSTLAAVDYATGTDVASLGVVGGGTEATALRVTLANDSTGVLSIDDNGGTITVDGTVTANIGTLNGLATEATLTSISGLVNEVESLLTSIKTAVELLDNAIAGSEFQVDVVGSLPAGSNLLGSVNVNGGSITVTGSEITVVPNGSWPVYQTTHDSLNCNANIQWSNVDVDLANPLPIDVLSIAAGNNNIGNVDIVTMPMVGISGGTIVVTDGGGAITVDGTITANLGTLNGAATEATLSSISGSVDGIETLLASIETSVQALDNAVSGSEFQVDLVGSLPSGSNTIGTVNIGTMPGVLVTGGTIATTKNSITRTSILVTGLSATLISAPGASTYLKIHNISMSNHGGPIRFSIKNGSGGSTLGQYTIAESGGGFKDDFMTTLTSNTALYYEYVSSQYNPLASINISYETI